MARASERPSPSRGRLGSLACPCHAIHVAVGCKLDPVSAHFKSRFPVVTECGAMACERRRWVYIRLGQGLRCKRGRKSKGESYDQSICTKHISSPDVPSSSGDNLSALTRRSQGMSGPCSMSATSRRTRRRANERQPNVRMARSDAAHVLHFALVKFHDGTVAPKRDCQCRPLPVPAALIDRRACCAFQSTRIICTRYAGCDSGQPISLQFGAPAAPRSRRPRSWLPWRRRG